MVENKGEQVFDGDTLFTDKSGYAYVIFVDNSVAKLRPETQLMIRGESRPDSRISNRRIDLTQGSVLLELEAIGSGTFEVQTSRSLASVKGTTFGNTAEGYIWVTEGQVDLTAMNSGQTVSLFEGMFGQVDPDGNAVDSGTIDKEKLDELNNDYGDMEGDYEEKTIIIRFRDANGQIRTEEIRILEKGN
jgi:ferric-dicitrate binding protein FerR (iron transport regulator)